MQSEILCQLRLLLQLFGAVRHLLEVRVGLQDQVLHEFQRLRLLHVLAVPGRDCLPLTAQQCWRGRELPRVRRRVHCAKQRRGRVLLVSSRQRGESLQDGVHDMQGRFQGGPRAGGLHGVPERDLHDGHRDADLRNLCGRDLREQHQLLRVHQVFRWTISASHYGGERVPIMRGGPVFVSDRLHNLRDVSPRLV